MTAHSACAAPRPLRRSLAFAALTLAACNAPPAAEEPGDTRPNIVYILADDLGYGELGCYGQTIIQTPNIDRLATQGMLFTQHYSGSPVCAPSRCVLLTGLHTGHSIVRNNWENGGWGKDAPEGQFPFPDDTVTLPRLLQDAGYHTGAFGKWGNGGPDSTGHPLNQGFDTFLGSLCQRQAHNYYPTHLWKDRERLDFPGNPWFASHQKIAEPFATEEEYFERFAAATYATDPCIDAAVEFIDESADAPFFLYYATPVPHASLQVPVEELALYGDTLDDAPYLGNKGYLPHPRPHAAYAAMITRFDRNVGRLLESLERNGLTDNTIVLFSSDNGPTFNGGTDSAYFNSAAGLRGLKCSVYEGGLRVPFIVRWPGRVAPGSRSDHISAFQDMLPTLLDVAGAPFEGETDGISLLPTLLATGTQAEHDTLYFEYAGQQAIRRGPWKGVRSKLRKGDTTLELYDLTADPSESSDIAAAHPEVRAQLEALLLSERVPNADFPLPTIDPPGK